MRRYVGDGTGKIGSLAAALMNERVKWLFPAPTCPWRRKQSPWWRKRGGEARK